MPKKHIQDIVHACKETWKSLTTMNNEYVNYTKEPLISSSCNSPSKKSKEESKPKEGSEKSKEVPDKSKRGFGAKFRSHQSKTKEEKGIYIGYSLKFAIHVR